MKSLVLRLPLWLQLTLVPLAMSVAIAAILSPAVLSLEGRTATGS